jgi:hypothetical protein
MSPLAQPPIRGYADWQRVDNFDMGIIYNYAPGVINFTHLSPVLDVSRFAYLGGRVGCALGGMMVIVYWYADAGGTVQLADRIFPISSLVTNSAFIRLPNLGPFMAFQVQAIAGANYNPQVNLFATNRVHPLEFMPEGAVLVDQQAVAIGAGSTNTTYPQDYYSGPAGVMYDPAYAAGFIELQYLTGAGNWDILDIVSGTTASTPARATMVMPPGAWRFQINNSTGAASSYYLTVTGSTTGAT